MLFELHSVSFVCVFVLREGIERKKERRMVRKSSCSKEGLKRGAWTSHEDKLLSDYIKLHGLGRWRSLPANAGLNRCGKSCRLRWLNYLRPDIKRGNITEEEEELIIRLHNLLGNRWSLIAGRLPGRTDNEIKNYWNTYLRRKVSANNSEQHQPSAIEENSAVNVIRTKAVRCTRTLFAHDEQIQEPNTANDIETASALAQPDFVFGMNERWIADIVQNSTPFPDLQVSKDGSCSTSDGLQGIGSVEVPFDDIGGMFSHGMMREGEGLYALFDHDTWDSLVVPKKM